MSRSYRRPYAAPTGVPRSHNDKKRAARGLRRTHNQWLKRVDDFEAALSPHRLECHWNNTYSWARDGRQSLVFPESKRVDDAVMRGYWIQLQRK